MIPLAPKFRSRGFNWRIVQREGDVAIVEQDKEGWSNPTLNVVIIQKNRERKWPDGRVSPASESLPNWNQWGEQAWTCSGIADARQWFNHLVDAAQDASALSAPCQSPKPGSEGKNRPVV